MTLTKWACALTLAFGATLIACAQTCPGFNTSTTSPQVASNTVQHSGADSLHSVSGTFYGSCQYQDSSDEGGSSCSVTCNVGTLDSSLDIGMVTSGFVHAVTSAGADGVAQASSGAVTCGGQAAGGATSCHIIRALFSACDISVSLSIPETGIGGSATFSSTPFWNHTLNYNLTCPAHNLSASNAPPPPQPGLCQPTGAAPYLPTDVGAEYVWDSATCTWTLEPCNVAGCDSPILLDTDGSGFQLSSAEEGVKFDFFANGHPIQIAWPQAGSTNGWLALPVDGKITNAAQLFGNLTPQPNSKSRNGFAALGMYDLPANGGNGDGVIDQLDAIWPQLRVWIDSNHDGVTQPGELLTLDKIGVKKIDLKYLQSAYVDQYGNHFRYKGRLRDDQGAEVNRTIYDVFLVAGK